MGAARGPAHHGRHQVRLDQFLQGILGIPGMVERGLVGDGFHHRLGFCARLGEQGIGLCPIMPVNGADSMCAGARQRTAARQVRVAQSVERRHLAADHFDNIG